MKYNKIMLHCDIKINKNLLYRNHIRCMDVPQKHLIFYFGYNTLHIGLIIQIIQFIRVIEHIIKLIIAIIILFRHDCKKLRRKINPSEIKTNMKPTIINIISFVLGNSEQTPGMTKLIPAAINIVVSSVLIGFSIPLLESQFNIQLFTSCIKIFLILSYIT